MYINRKQQFESNIKKQQNSQVVNRNLKSKEKRIEERSSQKMRKGIVMYKYNILIDHIYMNMYTYTCTRPCI